MKEDISLALLFGNTFRYIGKRIRKAFSEQDFPIGPEQFGLMDMISQKDEFIQSDLANLMDKDKSAILRHIDSLESMKLVMRVNDPIDRRKKFLVLTKPGEELIKKGRKLIESVLGELMTGIDDNQIDVLRSVLYKIQENAEKGNP